MLTRRELLQMSLQAGLASTLLTRDDFLNAEEVEGQQGILLNDVQS